MENPRKILEQRQMLQKKYDAARSNLLVAIVLTVVNIVLLFTESTSMLLFSVSVPYYVVIFGFIMGPVAASLVVAAVILGLYFICWLLSKKKSLWLVVAAVLFVVDTLVLVGLYLLAEEAYGILDAVIHVVVIFYLVSGAASAKKLKMLPEVSYEEAQELPEHSTPMRWAQEDVKCRILLEEEYAGHRICYRRVKRVNEFIIDGKVYDEYEALMEQPHTLMARIDGHTYEVGCNQQSRVFFNVDGMEIKSKVRLV